MKKGPLYLSILEILKEKIIDGIYPLHSYLPTENELEEEFQVSKITIRKAIEILEQEGYVLKQSGRGTTVISNSIFNKLSKGESFTNILQKEGLQLRKEKTTISKIKLYPQDELYRYFGSQSTCITRFYYLNGKPFIHFTHYLSGDIEISNIENDNSFSLYMLLYRNKQMIKNFHDEFYIDYPPLAILKELECEDSPLLGRKRLTYNNSNQVIEVSYARYNTKLHHYVINYHV